MPLSLSQHTHKFNSNQRKFPLTPFIALLFSSLFPSLSTHLPQFKQPYKVLLPSQRLSKFDKETHRTIAHIFVDFLCIIFYCGPGVHMCIVYTIIFISFHFILQPLDLSFKTITKQTRSMFLSRYLKHIRTHYNFFSVFLSSFFSFLFFNLFHLSVQLVRY